MTTDLWSFKDKKELEKNTSDFPETILKEQIIALAEKTDYVIYGKPIFMQVKNRDCEYKSATIFDVVVPSLDNYQKTLLIMYSNFEDNYPVAISVGRSYTEDIEDYSPEYTCADLESFKETLKSILASDKVMDMIKVLYSKANMLAKGE